MYEYRPRKNIFLRALIIITLMVLVSALSIYIYDMYSKIEVYSYSNTPSYNAARVSYKKDEEEIDTLDMLENITKCVVGISKIKNNGSTIFLNDSTKELGLGTGVIVSENGYIVTNYHVSGDRYSSCYVTFENGETLTAQVVWADSDLDLAILKVRASNLPYVTFGNSDSIRLGERTYAIGNPIGLEFQRTITSGIVSGLNRTIKISEDGKESYMEDLIQTDATINPGNSGGPLINSYGEVIGINSVKINEAEGIGFAIPINIIKPVVESFVNTGEFNEAYLGIFAYDKNVIPYLNSGISFEGGIYVADISYDGPCKDSNLRVGDIITKIDGMEVNKMSELRSYIYTKKPKDEVILTINRNKKEQEIKITLGKK